ncbi:double-strand break repair helicase AddA [Sandarakinorhabdus sp. AAP62]|uniref:double-strand break repair helicase AddA n=1 Tax=Sandarakinorhabdus sp. AAP62 TaxID=1248916 RepID=UPI0003054DCB|nr:double-strand break repair helicase AddA [Sandarakinorhabdus sp. AAP62]
MNRERTRALEPLKPAQADAADPQVHAWVAASAGTGKTQVLSARVLRLLLTGARPDAILCLTFTKLAAAEMQNRVMARLAWWAGCTDAELAHDLKAIGAATDAETCATARGLFAAVLEAPAGLAIQTIHSFAQGLIASFPVEAGITPGFQTLDDRAAALLRRRVLTDALTDTSNPRFLADVAEIAIDGGEARLQAIMKTLARHGAALAELRVEGVEPLLRRALGLADGDSEAATLAAGIAALPLLKLQQFAQALGRQDKATSQKLAGNLVAFLMASNKPALWDQLWRLFFSTKNEPLLLTTLVLKDLDAENPDWRPFCAELQAQLLSLRADLERWQILAFAGRHLRVAVRLAQDWRAAKHRAGVIDYDDMIAAAARLLGEPGAADWVRFKLDSRIDHVLVDEAQDTNLLQWQVIRALVEEYFSGLGQRDQFRSLFVVGDFKQSIMGFQGADPLIYADMREVFFQLCEAEPDRWKELPLTVNFRSVPAILDVVDQVIGHVGPEMFDPQGVEPHVAHKQGAGLVMLWPPLLPDAGSTADEDDDDAAEDDSPPLAQHIAMARHIAATVAGWLAPETALILPASGRRAAAQDILVLVRKRSGLMNALVTALHEAGVPVAGADRLNLAEPLAVADLLALVQFACQPDDDLTLAALLVSPFCGLDHDQLTGIAAGRPGSLWAAVLASDDPAVAAPRAVLAEVLRLAADVSPYRFLETILSGPLAGRRKLLARLGEEARDAIDTVLDQALACEAAGAASLQAFVAWMAAEDLEVKRDPEAAIDAVRLMTVHGAKGLQAPIVIMADACHVPPPEKGALLLALGNGPELPLWVPTKLVAPPAFLAAAETDRAARAAREHRRLLYVALTRAEEVLCIGGATKPGKKWDVHPESWYQLVEGALTDLEAVDNPHWPQPVRLFRSGPPTVLREADVKPDATLLPTDRWWLRQAPAEARPPRPLAPSSLGPDTVADPPPDAARLAAARRGTALHRLFETLPGLAIDVRREVALQWCALNVPDLEAEELAATVLAVLDDPEFAAVFAAGALTEAPVAAVLGETVIAGSIDRLLVSETEVLAVDFKTGSRVPAGLDMVPPSHLAQMGAYAAALARVFPGRTVRAGLLYTAGPRLIEVPGDVLSAWQPSAALQPDGPAPIYPM